MAKDVAKHHFINLYYEMKKEGVISSQKEFAEKLNVSPQSLTLVLNPENQRGVSQKMQTKAIEVFSLDADYFLQPIDHVDNIVYQNSKTAGVKSVESIVNKVAEAYEAQIKLLREKIERLENE